MTEIIYQALGIIGFVVGIFIFNGLVMWGFISFIRWVHGDELEFGYDDTKRDKPPARSHTS